MQSTLGDNSYVTIVSNNDTKDIDENVVPFKYYLK